MRHGKKPTKERLAIELAEARQLISELQQKASDHAGIQEAIRGSEERYRNLVENAHDVLWVFDLNLGYTYVSPSVKRLRGYSVEEAMQQSLDQVMTPESYERAKELFERELNLEMNGHLHGPEYSFTSEFELIRKDGSVFWAEITVNPLYDAAGQVKGIMGITRDITERRQAQEELRKHRDHLEDLVRERTNRLIRTNERLKREIEDRKLAENALLMSEEIYRIHFSLSNDVLFTSDEEFQMRSVTPNVERILGYTPGELVDRSIPEMNVLHPDDLEKAMDNAMNVLRGGKSRHPVFRFITKDGKIKFGEVSGVPLIKKGSGTMLISVAREVTDRIEQEQTLLEFLDRFRTHFSLTNDIMFTFNHKFMITSVSPNAQKASGYTPEELMARPMYELGLMAPEYMEEAHDNALHLLSGQTILSSIYELIVKDGSRRFTEISGSPLIRDGRVVEVVCVAREITHQLAHETSMQETRAISQALLNACTDFMALIDTEGKILHMNKAASVTLGKNGEELVGSCIFSHLPRDVAQRRRIYFDQVISTGRPVRFKDERENRLVHTSLYPVQNLHGKVTRVAIFSQDTAWHR